VHNR